MLVMLLKYSHFLARNLHKTDTIGEQPFGRYRELSGLPGSVKLFSIAKASWGLESCLCYEKYAVLQIFNDLNYGPAV